MFSEIFIEEEVLGHERTEFILSHFPKVPHYTIHRVEESFGKVKRPYLQKRQDLRLYIGKKRGTLVKKAPDAYGTAGAPHYYFIHAYNCLYECEYCYLQGHFQSPDMVFFVNHDEVGQEITRLVNESHSAKEIWFHAGEFSDSLALSHLTGELPYYYSLFTGLPKARLELRTKSANIRPLMNLTPVPNVVVSFSLSPQKAIQSFDLKTPPLKHRLQAIRTLSQIGHKIGIHFDPIIYDENLINEYTQLVEALKEAIPLEQLEYISLGVVRFTKDVYHQVQKNYPHSSLLAQEFVTSFDGKIRYPKPLRLQLMKQIKNLCLAKGAQAERVYLCMENE